MNSYNILKELYIHFYKKLLYKKTCTQNFGKIQIYITIKNKRIIKKLSVLPLSKFEVWKYTLSIIKVYFIYTLEHFSIIEVYSNPTLLKEYKRSIVSNLYFKYASLKKYI